LVISSYGTNMTMPVMPVIIPKNRVVMSLFALAVNDAFKYPYYFSMFPAGSDGTHEISRGFFEIAKEWAPALRTVAIISADTDFAKKSGRRSPRQRDHNGLSDRLQTQLSTDHS
jgi:hypothetical protein